MESQIENEMGKYESGVLETIRNVVVARDLELDVANVKPENRLIEHFRCDPRDYDYITRSIGEKVGVQFSDEWLSLLVKEDPTLEQLALSLTIEIYINWANSHGLTFDQQEMENLCSMSVAEFGALLEEKMRARRAKFLKLASQSHSWKEAVIFVLLVGWIFFVIAMTAESPIVNFWALGGFGLAFALASERSVYWKGRALIIAVSLAELGGAAAYDFGWIEGAVTLAGPRGLPNNAHSLLYIAAALISPLVGWVAGLVGRATYSRLVKGGQPIEQH